MTNERTNVERGWRVTIYGSKIRVDRVLKQRETVSCYLSGKIRGSCHRATIVDCSRFRGNNYQRGKNEARDGGMTRER